MAGKMMRAVRYDSYGGGAAGLKHVQVPLPSPNKDEVLLKVEAVSLNPFDWKIQERMLWPILPPKFPFIPGTDVAGEIVEIGRCVKKFKPGDKVVAVINPFNGGGLAEYGVAKESSTVLRPLEVSAAEAACLVCAGLTALQAITKSTGLKLDGTNQKRSTFLITAASGGVGHYAVQFARLIGNAHVTATCGARNVGLVKTLGADEVLDYKTPQGESLKSPSGKKYDIVVHCANSVPFSTFEPNLSDNGRVIDINTPRVSSLATYLMKKLSFSKKQCIPFLMIPRGEDLEFLVNLVKEGKIKTVIDSKYPLSKAEDAWAKSMSGHATGKIVVEP